MGVLDLGPLDLRSLWCALLLAYVGSQHGTALDWGPFGVGEWVEWRKIAIKSFHFETSLDSFFWIRFDGHFENTPKTDRRLTGN